MRRLLNSLRLSGLMGCRIGTVDAVPSGALTIIRSQHNAEQLESASGGVLTDSGSPFYAYDGTSGSDLVTIEEHVQADDEVGVAVLWDAVSDGPASLQGAFPGQTRPAWEYGVVSAKYVSGSDPESVPGITPLDSGGSRTYNYCTGLVIPSGGTATIVVYSQGNRGSTATTIYTRPIAGSSGVQSFQQGGAQDRVYAEVLNAAGTTIASVQVAQPASDPPLRSKIVLDDAIPGGGTGTITLEVFNRDTDTVIDTVTDTYDSTQVDWSTLHEFGRNDGDNLFAHSPDLVIETYSGDDVNATGTLVEAIYGVRSGVYLDSAPSEYLASTFGGTDILPVASRINRGTAATVFAILGQSLADGTPTGQDPVPSKAVEGVLYDKGVQLANYGVNNCAYETMLAPNRICHKYGVGGTTMLSWVNTHGPAAISAITGVATVEHRTVKVLVWDHGQQDARSDQGDHANYKTRFDSFITSLEAAVGTFELIIIFELDPNLNPATWDERDEMQAVLDAIVAERSNAIMIPWDVARYTKHDDVHPDRIGCDNRAKDLLAAMVARGY